MISCLESRSRVSCLEMGSELGDSYNTDIPGAKKAGMLACWFNTHGSCPAQMNTKPDVEVSSLDEIFQILD